MRQLTAKEITQIAGGNEHQCTPGNSIGGVSNFPSIGGDLINFYEGIVAATSHVIERVAGAFD